MGTVCDESICENDLRSRADRDRTDSGRSSRLTWTEIVHLFFDDSKNETNPGNLAIAILSDQNKPKTGVMASKAGLSKRISSSSAPQTSHE
jgi:hypothetical protein